MHDIDDQTEHWLESQTRDIRMPDGTVRQHTAFKLIWDTADGLIQLSGYTMDELVGFACEEAYLQKLEFNEAFKGIVAWLDRKQRESIHRALDGQ